MSNEAAQVKRELCQQPHKFPPNQLKVVKRSDQTKSSQPNQAVLVDLIVAQIINATSGVHSQLQGDRWSLW